MRYSTILWDLDHTLLDSDASLNGALDETLRSAGVADLARAAASFHTINHSLWREVEAGNRSPNEVKTLRFERLTNELVLDVDPVELAERFADGMGRLGELYPGAREVLEHARDMSERMAIVTNGIGSIQRARIDRLDIAGFFDAVVISGEVGAAKPGTEIFDITFARLNTDTTDAVMIGDNLTSDIQGAVNSGIDSIWLDHATDTAFEQQAGSVVATHRVTSVPDIAHVL